MGLYTEADMSDSKEILDSLSGGKLVIGSKDLRKTAKRGALKKIFLSSNAPPSLKKDFRRYSEASSLEMEMFDGDSIKLGQVCGKPFKILAVGIKR